MLERLKKQYIDHAQRRINENNRTRLTNPNPFIVSNDCTGGFLYKYLGIPYTTPFMWVGLASKDYITALAHFDNFLNTPICLDEKSSEKNGYPTARGWGDIPMIFPHAQSFEAASQKWEERKTRLERIPIENGSYHYLTEHIGFLITEGFTDRDTLEKFAVLPYPHKVAFISDHENSDIPCTFLIEGWKKDIGLWSVKNKWTGARYIDDFDYVSFLNSL